jgi:hypothetical protein
MNSILSQIGKSDEMSSADRVEKPEKRGSAATVRVSALPSHQAHYLVCGSSFAHPSCLAGHVHIGQISKDFYIEIIR